MIRSTFKFSGYFVFFLVTAIVLGVVTTALSFFPGIFKKTFTPENAITSYERFYDLHAAFTERIVQISVAKDMLANSQGASESELQRLRTEVAGAKYSCAHIASMYNAESEKKNKEVFKSEGLPHKLLTTECE